MAPLLYQLVSHDPLRSAYSVSQTFRPVVIRVSGWEVYEWEVMTPMSDSTPAEMR
jgi:pyruvate-formate lyase